MVLFGSNRCLQIIFLQTSDAFQDMSIVSQEEAAGRRSKPALAGQSSTTVTVH